MRRTRPEAPSATQRWPLAKASATGCESVASRAGPLSPVGAGADPLEGPLPATVWIEKDAPNQLVQAELEQSSGNSVQLTLSDWDKPVTVTKPAV